MLRACSPPYVRGAPSPLRPSPPASRAQTDTLNKAAQAVFRQYGNNFAHSGKVAHSEQSRYHHRSGIFAKFFINNALTQYNRRFFAKHPVFYIQSPEYPRYRIT